ncbi:MAG: hypothetical protein ACYDHY_17505 [Acidiferrobacterales bacterium]
MKGTEVIRRLVFVLAVFAALLKPGAALAQSAPNCQYILGFATLHSLDAADVGDCLDNQAFAANGDAVQHTTNGLLAWRKADNWTAFTNGYWTWINGPYGLAKRLNTQRYSWEANPDGLPAPAVVDVNAGHTFYASTYHRGAYQADRIYCDDDPGWRTLSPAYLVSYPSLAAAEFALPGYHLHQSC